MRFGSADELAAWLAAHGVSTAAYGMGGAKSVDDLLEELDTGESVLQLSAGDGEPTRHVSVLNLLITNERGQVGGALLWRCVAVQSR